MKMFLGGKSQPINTLKLKHFELDTNDCDVLPSDLQSGISCFARGQKIIGTGKSFEFANYGGFRTNFPIYIPSLINIVEIASTEYPIKINIALSDMKDIDFSTSQNVGYIIADGINYTVNAVAKDNFLTLSCDKTIYLQIFYGRDNYV